MIVKIWPINADYSMQKGKPGGWQGVRNAQKYIENAEKVVVPQEDTLDFGFDDADTNRYSVINTEKDFHRVIDYMSNEDKTEAKYISKYMCASDDITKDFRLTAERIAYESHGKTKLNTGAMAFHIVQSFPADLNISNEEVHQCGIELVKRLEKYQAVICSHVHPVVGDDGEEHGKCKHNHILINAFMHPDFYDAEKGGPRKYHACKETYRQLQIYNDEIAIEHGLPIIRNPDQDRVYSWYEENEKNAGMSWKERVRIDISEARRRTNNWNQFVNHMKVKGYEVSEKSHITYTTPDGNKVRDNNLGEEFTQKSLKLYWSLRDHNMKRIKKDLQMNENIFLSDYIVRFGQKLSVKIPLGNSKTGENTAYYLPLNKDIKADDNALRTYVQPEQLYDICDQNGQPVLSVSGTEIVQSIEDLRDEELMKHRADEWLYKQQLQARRRLREKEHEDEEKEKRKEYYQNQQFKNSQTGNPYFISVYDEDGRRRSAIELVIILALIVLDKEEYLWTSGEINPNQENEIFFASTNWKIQNLYDAMELAREEDLETPAQLEKRLKAVGSDLSRKKSALKKVSLIKEMMDPVAEIVDEYKQVHALAESILDLPEGQKKEQLQMQHGQTIDQYQSAKQILKRYKITDAKGITDFDARYERVQTDIRDLEAQKTALSEQYRKLKKLEYNLQLAEDPRFIYGPNYSRYQQSESKINISK